MPFEPKLVRAETPLDSAREARVDDDFETGLPGDLEALACQLRDDAVRLSSLYPADNHACDGSIEPAARGLPRSVWKWVSYGSGAALLIAVAAALPWIVSSGDVPSGDVPSGEAPQNIDTAGGTISPNKSPAKDTAENENRVARAPLESVDVHPATHSNGSPALLLLNVSGPELEGLFDLWEADSVEQSRISI